MPAPPPLVLRRPDQVRAVSSPVAHRIVSVMERLRRATVAELADRTGIEAGSLYYHVRKMKAVGVLIEHERRSTGGRDEVVYELPGREVVFDPDAVGPVFLRELARSVRTRLRWVERVFTASLETRKKRRSARNSPPDPTLHQHHARLSPTDRKELYRRIEELEQFLVDRDDPERRDFTNVTVVVLPEADAS